MLLEMVNLLITVICSSPNWLPPVALSFEVLVQGLYACVCVVHISQKVLNRIASNLVG